MIDSIGGIQLFVAEFYPPQNLSGIKKEKSEN